MLSYDLYEKTDPYEKTVTPLLAEIRESKRINYVDRKTL